MNPQRLSSSRLTPAHRRAAAAAALVGTVALTPALAGPLDPPPGPPAPTMKRLDQIEPRRCLNDMVSADASATAVVSITEPGRYYLTADLVVPPGKSGVVVGAVVGSVEIDLNGYSVRGLAGAVDGIVARSLGPVSLGNKLVIFGGQARGGGGGAGGLIFGFSGRGIATGDPDGDGCPDVVIADLTVLNCAKGLEHLHPQKIVHRDLACRSCPQGGISIFGADAPPPPPPGTAGRRRGNSISMTRIELADCGGPASVRVVLPGGGRVSVDEAVVSRSAGDGISVSYPSAAGLAESGSSVRCRKITCIQGSYNGLVVSGPQGTRDVGVSVEGLSVEGGASALALTDVGTVLVDGVNAYKSGDDPITHKRAGKAKYKNIVLKRGLGGFRAEDCDELEIAGLSVSGGTAASAWMTLVKRVSIVGGSVDDISVGADGTGGHGLLFADCESVKVSDFGMSRCAGHGVLHTFTAAGSQAAKGISHWGTRVERCAGAGVVVMHQRPGMGELDVSMRDFSILSCDAGGLLVDASAAGPGARVSVRCQDGSCRSSSGGSGGGLLCGSTSHFLVQMNNVGFTGNAGDGLAVINAAAPGTAIAGQTTLHGCDLSNNGGSGCVTDNPLYAEKTTFSDNVLFGTRCVAQDPFTLAGSLNGCTVAKNKGGGSTTPRGRFANVDCQFTDNGGNGVTMGEGCLLMTNTMVHRSAGDGVSVNGTLTIQGGALRRNAGAGARSSGGPVSIENASIELNGTGSSATPAGSGGIALSECTSIRVSRCSVSENTGPGLRHIRAQGTFSDMSSADVSESTFSHNAGLGAGLDGLVGGAVTGCTFAGNAAGGLLLGQDARRVRVSGTSFTSPPWNGVTLVRVLGTGNLLTGNSFSGGDAAVPPIAAAQGNTVGQIVQGADVSARCSPNDNIVH